MNDQKEETKSEELAATVPVASDGMLSAKEYLHVALGGNMNFGTLKPLAIEEIMDAYYEHRVKYKFYNVEP